MTDAPVDLDQSTEDLLRRKARGVKAPCRQCGDTLAKCMSQPGLCCVGCNHASRAPELTAVCSECDMETGGAVRCRNCALPQPAPPADREPFAPMECCGRDRDKDGGPNTHCECPAPFKASPAPRSEPSALPCKACGGCGLVHYRARGGSITGSGPCACRIENHLKGKR